MSRSRQSSPPSSTKLQLDRFSPYQALLEHHLSVDDADSIKSLLNIFQKNFDFSKELFTDLLMLSCNVRAYQAMNVLLKMGTEEKLMDESTITTLAKTAAQRADGQMVLLLENNDYSAAAKHLFNPYFLKLKRSNKVNVKKNDLSKTLLALLRFMPIEKVDLLVSNFRKKILHKRKNSKISINKLNKNFIKQHLILLAITKKNIFHLYQFFIGTIHLLIYARVQEETWNLVLNAEN